MESLLSSLQSGEGVRISLVDEGLMKPHCECGHFLKVRMQWCPTVDEVSNQYFSNLDVWERTSYIVLPDIFD